MFDKDVSPLVFFGSGNENGFYTLGTSKDGKIQIGLRGKVRGESVYNSDGKGTYSFDSGAGTSSTTAKWNFEFSINTQVGCDSASQTCTPLDSYKYEIAVDKDPTFKNTPVKWDPITPSAAFPCFDHDIGTASTVDTADTSYTCAEYPGAIHQNTVAQQSWNYGFFPNLFTFNPEAEGIYDVSLLAKDKKKGAVLDKVNIRILASNPTNCASRGKCFPTTKSDCSPANVVKFKMFFKSGKECEEFLKGVKQ